MQLNVYGLLAHLWLAAFLALSADPPQKYPDWPTAPAIPQPMPPNPKIPVSNIDQLRPGELYVVQHDKEPMVQLLASAEGIVKITRMPSPCAINGIFVDGKGERETRVYDAKQIFLVERVKAGTLELIKVPQGLVERRTLTDDQLPIPPPKPPVPPTPADPLLTPVQAAYTADLGAAKALDKKEMQAVYAALSTVMNTPQIVTAKNLFDLNKNSMDARIDGRLVEVRRTFSTDFGTIFPPNTPESHVLTQTERDAAAARLKRYVAVLAEVK